MLFGCVYSSIGTGCVWACAMDDVLVWLARVSGPISYQQSEFEANGDQLLLTVEKLLQKGLSLLRH